MDFPISDPGPNHAMMASVFFAQLWGMPLLFVVAGAVTATLSMSGEAGGFVRERLRRLLVPDHRRRALGPAAGLLFGARRRPGPRSLLFSFGRLWSFITCWSTACCSPSSSGSGESLGGGWWSGRSLAAGGRGEPRSRLADPPLRLLLAADERLDQALFGLPS